MNSRSRCVTQTVPKPIGRGDTQFARRLGRGIGKQRLGGMQLGHHFDDGAVQQLALLGQHQAARMPVKQGDLQVAARAPKLAGSRPIGSCAALARVGEAARFGGRMKNPELVPVHVAFPASPVGTSAPRGPAVSARHGQASYRTAASCLRLQRRVQWPHERGTGYRVLPPIGLCNKRGKSSVSGSR